MIQAIYEELSRSQGSGRRPPAQATTIPFCLTGLRDKLLNFVDAAIFEISQDELHIDQIHRFNIFLLNIHRFKIQS